MWPLRTIAYFTAFWIACILSIANPIWGVVNYMLVYQMNPVKTWWGRPISEFGIRYSLYAVAFTVLGMLVNQKRVPKIKPLLCLWEIGLIALVVIAAINLTIDIGGFNPKLVWNVGRASGYPFEKLWKMFLFVLIMTRLATTRENLRLIIWSLVIGSLYLGYDAYTAPAWAFFTGRLDHMGGPDFSKTSGFAAHLSAMLPIIAVAFLIAPKWRWKAIAAVAGGLTVNAIVMCRTRSAFIGLMIGALCAFLLAPRARRYKIYVLLIVGGTVAFTLTDVKYWNRMSTMSSAESLRGDRAAELRLTIWRASFQVLLDHPYGVGVGNFPRVIGMYNYDLHKRSSHNTLIAAFVELGVHGGVIFLLLVAGSLSYAYRSSRLAHLTGQPLETRLIAYAFIVSGVTYFVTGLGTDRFQCESYWWVLALPLCLYRSVLHELRVSEEVPALAQPQPAQGMLAWEAEPYG